MTSIEDGIVRKGGKYDGQYLQSEEERHVPRWDVVDGVEQCATLLLRLLRLFLHPGDVIRLDGDDTFLCFRVAVDVGRLGAKCHVQFSFTCRFLFLHFNFKTIY